MNVTTTAAPAATPRLGNGGLTMLSFQIAVRTATMRTRYSAPAASASDAWSNAADLFGDIPCGITVTPGRPQ